MRKKGVLFLTGAMLLNAITFSFSQERINVKPLTGQAAPGSIQPRPRTDALTEKKGPGGFCSKLSFTTSSPLPSTGLGWDYKFQLNASGGYPPVYFYGFAVDNVTKAEAQGQHLSVSGLTITPDGIIKGQPEEAGYHLIRIVVQDSCPSGIQRVEKKFALEVKGPAK